MKRKVKSKRTYGKNYNRELHSSSDESDGTADVDIQSDISSDEETAQEKKIRLAREYINEIEQNELKITKEDSSENIRNRVSQQLDVDHLKQSDAFFHNFATKLQSLFANAALKKNDSMDIPETDHAFSLESQLSSFSPQLAECSKIILKNGHKRAVTCIAISSKNEQNSEILFSGSKDCCIVKWNITNAKKLWTIRKQCDPQLGLTSGVNCLALTSDNELLASGEENNLIQIWNVSDCSHVRCFTGHRDAITGLSFRSNTNQLFSASADKSVKIWDCDDMAYIETLFGHQDRITSISSLSLNRALTSGGRDRTARIWKVAEESQLVFHGSTLCSSIDCAAFVTNNFFVTGAQDNSLSLWSVWKKKPIFTLLNAHKLDKQYVYDHMKFSERLSKENTSKGKDKLDSTKSSKFIHSDADLWISALAALPNSDVIASGAGDGKVRIWSLVSQQDSSSHSEDSSKFRPVAIKPLLVIPVASGGGFINALEFERSGKYLAVGVGQEHRFGRWWCLKEAKNNLIIIPLIGMMPNS